MLYCQRSLTQDRVFLCKKCPSSAWVIGPQLAQRNPTALVLLKLDRPQHKNRICSSVCFHILLESIQKRYRHTIFPLKCLLRLIVQRASSKWANILAPSTRAILLLSEQTQREASGDKFLHLKIHLCSFQRARDQTWSSQRNKHTNRVQKHTGCWSALLFHHLLLQLPNHLRWPHEQWAAWDLICFAV